jgi:hypothetical protein
MIDISAIDTEQLIRSKLKRKYTVSYLGFLDNHLRNVSDLLQGNPASIKGVEWVSYSGDSEIMRAELLTKTSQTLQTGINALANLTPSQAIKRLKTVSDYLAASKVLIKNYRLKSEIPPRQAAVDAASEILTDISAAIATNDAIKEKMAQAGLASETIFRH